MDLPSVCPICDSERVNYTYLLRHDAAARGTLVFRCADCGSYVESLITDFDPPDDEPQSTPHSIPAQRLQPHGRLDDHEQPSPTLGWTDVS